MPDEPPDTGDGPYRAPGDTRLGRVVHRFPVMRRPRYLGSARAVATARPLYIGRLVTPPPPASPLGLTRRPSGEAVEVCVRGVRVCARGGTLELTWDQIVRVRRVDDGGGLAAVVIVGVHGEEVRLDRSVRGLAELAAALDAARAP